MSNNEWVTLFRSVELKPVNGRELSRPDDAQLDVFERASGFRFPQSYRGFIKVFGPGELADRFVVRAPGYAIQGRSDVVGGFNETVDIQAFNASLPIRMPSEQAYARKRYQDYDRLSRLVFFADYNVSDVIGWDPADSRKSDEYGIYILMQDEDRLRLISADFRSFILDVCFGTGFFQVEGDNYDIATLEPFPRSFRPSGMKTALQ